MVKVVKDRGITSIALPPLGAGNGGIEWHKVRRIIEHYLSDIACDVFVYEPSVKIKEVLNQERVKLTPPRAMSLAVLYELVLNGEFVSEFASEKIAYFLQRFGAKQAFNLEFQPNFYGPYSEKVKHVLYYLNGKYIIGYSSKDKKPFEKQGLITETEKDVSVFLNHPNNKEFRIIVDRTKSFLSGFYSPFGLELLSTIDFIMDAKNVKTQGEIFNELEKWSDRKKNKIQ